MFGTNKITKPFPKEDGSLKVHSIFYTIQGEGPDAGRPAVFIRLSHCNLACTFCFVGSTMITMADGKRKRIDAIRRGESVLSYDENSGLFVPAKVRNTMQSNRDKLLHLIFSKSGRGITCTEEHPFYVRGKGWVAANKLTSGDAVVHFTSSDRMRMFNSYRPVEFTKKRRQAYNGDVFISSREVLPGSKAWVCYAGSKSGVVTTYNLEVEGTHTYIANSKVVHNCDTQFDSGSWLPADEIVKRVQKITLALNEHAPRLVVITGGEPLLQNVVPVVHKLNHKGYSCSIETAGTHMINGLQYHFAPNRSICDNAIVCSPKTGKINRDLAPFIHALKYVISHNGISGKDGLPNVSTQRRDGALLEIARPSQAPQALVYVQPMDIADDEEATKKNIKMTVDVAMNFGYRLSVQVHKIVGLP